MGAGFWIKSSISNGYTVRSQRKAGPIQGDGNVARAVVPDSAPLRRVGHSHPVPVGAAWPQAEKDLVSGRATEGDSSQPWRVAFGDACDNFAAPMITVGCAGFAVPATRFFKEYLFVEVQETHIAVPGQGTLRRWKREAPKGFEFAMLGPREIGQEGFRAGKVIETALETLHAVGDVLSATTAVFVAPPDFTANRANRAALKDFLVRVKPQFNRVVFEPGPAWDPDDADSIAVETGTLASRDPLSQGLSKREIAYYRLPGPAGHKSRYEDPAIEELAALGNTRPDQNAIYVFTNVDMFADGKRLRKALKTGAA
ncbi:MAG: DUF72 domain-containing protein [Polyangiaceae bacterium]